MHDYLTEVYRLHRQWKTAGRAKRYAKNAARSLRLGIRRSAHPIRIIIEATSDETDIKKKSRWGRALEYAHKKAVKPKHLVTFFRAHGGISGCAAAACQANPKRSTRKSDWD
jgi:hypothetical protein